MAPARAPPSCALLSAYVHDQVVWLRNHPSVLVWVLGSDKLPWPDVEKRYKRSAGRDRSQRARCWRRRRAGTSKVSGPDGREDVGAVQLRDAQLLVRGQPARRRLRLQHRDRPRAAGAAARQLEEDDPGRQAVADQRRLELPLRRARIQRPVAVPERLRHPLRRRQDASRNSRSRPRLRTTRRCARCSRRSAPTSRRPPAWCSGC